jgi:hypothetical protein
MEPEERAAIDILVREYLNGKKNGKWRVHPTNAVRHGDGHFYTLHTHLQEDPARVFNCFRMKSSAVDGLLSRNTRRNAADTSRRWSTGPEGNGNNSREETPDTTSDGR